jgi:hypothetical protein
MNAILVSLTDFDETVVAVIVVVLTSFSSLSFYHLNFRIRFSFRILFSFYFAAFCGAFRRPHLM